MTKYFPDNTPLVARWHVSGRGYNADFDGTEVGVPILFGIIAGFLTLIIFGPIYGYYTPGTDGFIEGVVAGLGVTALSLVYVAIFSGLVRLIWRPREINHYDLHAKFLELAPEDQHLIRPVHDVLISRDATNEDRMVFHDFMRKIEERDELRRRTAGPPARVAEARQIIESIDVEIQTLREMSS